MPVRARLAMMLAATFVLVAALSIVLFTGRNDHAGGTAFEHSAYVVLMDAKGVQRVGWPVDKVTPEGLAHDLRLLGA